MLTLKPFSRRSMVGRWCTPNGIPPQRPRRTPSLSFRAGGSTPRALAHMLDSLVRVSRRGVEKHFVRGRSRPSRPQSESVARRGKNPPRQKAAEATLSQREPAPSPAQQTHPDSATPRPAARKRTTIWVRPNTASLRFHFSNFRYSFTLFSKCFSSFPHGTCSLSVSCPYLALDEIYHPFWAAFPNNPTLRKRPVEHRKLAARYGILTLSDASFQRTWTASYPESASLNYNSPRSPLEISNLSYSRFTRRY